MWAKQNKAVLEASYRIAFHIAQAKKPYTIGKELIKPCLIEATTLVLRGDKANKLKELLLSNDTVKKRISEMSQDILFQVEEDVGLAHYYSCNWTSPLIFHTVPSCWSMLATSLRTT